MPSLAQLAAAATAVLAALAAAGCGSSGAKNTVTHIATSSTTTAQRPPPRPAAVRPKPSYPPVGATQTVHAGGATLSVAIQRVIDPLRDSGAALLTGDRAVGVFVQIRNNGPGIYDSSATGDVSIVPSAGTTTPVFAAQGVCQTPLRDFDNYIIPGQVRNGCVVFALESDAKLLAVRFSPHGETPGRTTWRASS
jgi:hypothetical protein